MVADKKNSTDILIHLMFIRIIIKNLGSSFFMPLTMAVKISFDFVWSISGSLKRAQVMKYVEKMANNA